MKRVLKEYYKGPLYHYTTLPLAYSIMQDNCLNADVPACEFWETKEDCVCLTRDKNYNLRGQEGIVVRFTFDGDSLMNIRHGKLKPFNWHSLDPHNTWGPELSEKEERFYANIEPFDRYVEAIDIYIYNLGGYHDTDIEDEMYEEIEEENPNLSESEIGKRINEWFLNEVQKMSNFQGKINIYNKINKDMKQVVRITEGELKKIINESVNIILNELDWRTYEKAAELADDAANNASDEYEKTRRINQRDAFRSAAKQRATSQYNLNRYDANKDDDDFNPSQGELKNLSRRNKDVQNFYQDKQEYRDGKWQDKL